MAALLIVGTLALVAVVAVVALLTASLVIVLRLIGSGDRETTQTRGAIKHGPIAFAFKAQGVSGIYLAVAAVALVAFLAVLNQIAHMR